MSEAICTCHCGGAMFYRHLHAESCVLSREGEEAPKSELQTLRDERDRLRRDYDELIMAVGNKYPGETRHQTALRYIQRAEEPSNVPAKAALTPAGGEGN